MSRIPAVIPTMSNYFSRDLSWLKFNERVLDQARNKNRSVFDRLKFLAITASNLDEFFQIRVGSLYNYLDYHKERIDYTGLRETAFRKKLLMEVQGFYKEQIRLLQEDLKPLFEEAHFKIAQYQELSPALQQKADAYFQDTLFPMLTPMTYDNYHSFPILVNKLSALSVITKNPNIIGEQRRLSFVQVPQNLPRFYELREGDQVLFVPITDIIRRHISNLFRNVEIISVGVIRIVRNGDFSVDESDDVEEEYIEELKKKLNQRKTARVVRVEVEKGAHPWMMDILKERYQIDEYNIFENPDLIDYTSLWQIVGHSDFKDKGFKAKAPVMPISLRDKKDANIFDILKEQDVLLHHPFNDISYLVNLIEQAADDPQVLAIKITIYRLAKNSRITNALHRAAEKGKHVSVLFEVKARFDEENNIKEAQRLQKAGCFVIYGMSRFKTHTKLLLIVRREASEKVMRYVHLSSGNYNEDTARLYTDVALMSTNEAYGRDVSEFFNHITGHSIPPSYERLITAPGSMRNELIRMILREAENKRNGLPAGIAIKVNSLQDQACIDALYQASQAGVSIKLIVRGICCLRPNVPGLSEHILVRSIVGDFLEHTRLYYFHNAGQSEIYGGSADMMIRSFDRRIESLYRIEDPAAKREAMAIIEFNLRDNVNSYELNASGDYTTVLKREGEEEFNIHERFFNLTLQDLEQLPSLNF
jgi:polyphosphate kinase